MPRGNRRHLTRNDNVHRVESQYDRVTLILRILVAHASQGILLRVYRNGRLRRKATSANGNEYTFPQRAYDVPALAPGANPNKDINRKWNTGVNQWFFDWKVGSDDDGYKLQIGDEVRVFRATEVQPRRRAQAFASGVTHCILHPILLHAQSLLEGKEAEVRELKSGPTFKVVPKNLVKIASKYRKMVETIEALMVTYAKGIPEAAMQEVADAIGKHLAVRIAVQTPFASLPAIVDVTSRQKSSGKNFTYINTCFDHADLHEATREQVTIVDATTLQEMVHDLDAAGTYYTYQQNKDTITSVSTLQGTFKIKSDFYDAVMEFEHESGLEYLKIDALKNPELSEFICQGTHYNNTAWAPHGDVPEDLKQMANARHMYDTYGCTAAVDEQGNYSSEEEAARVAALKADYDAARKAVGGRYVCIDIKKSYASFHESPLYEDDYFPSKFTTFRPTSSWDLPGMYRITDIDYSKAHPHMLFALSILGHPFQNMNVYPRVDLTTLSYGLVTFRVVEGAYCDGHQDWVNFRFPGAPANKETGEPATGFYQRDYTHDKKGVPYYSKYSGLCNHISLYKTFWMKGSAAYFENLRSYMPDGCRVRRYEDDAGQLEFPKKAVFHLSQISAYINAYERQKMIIQLVHMAAASVPERAISWIDKDDLTYDKTLAPDFELMPYMSKKSATKKSFANILQRAEAYVNGLWQVETNFLDGDVVCPHAPINAPEEKRPGGVIFCVGPGGASKTHDNLTDAGIVNAVFVAPSYELLEDKKAAYNCKGYVFDKIFQGDPQLKLTLFRLASTFIWDETSMRFFEDVQRCIKDFFFHRHIFCGDIGYQLGPINRLTGVTLTPLSEALLRDQGFPIYHFTHSYRIKCEDLRDVITRLRTMIDEVRNEGDMRRYLLNVLAPRGQVVSFEEALDLYTIRDAIITSRNDFADEYTHVLKERLYLDADGQRIRRYRVLENAPMPNGKIILAHAPPFPECVETYASTAHAMIGKATLHKIFIDARRMWELTHWQTAIGRASYLSQIYIVDVPVNPPAEAYKDTLIYQIVSPHTNKCYIGHTVKPLELRFQGHARDYKNRAKLTKKCTSVQIFEAGGARIELVEAYPCASKAEAEAREAHWIQRSTTCVNKCVPGGTGGSKRKR